MKWVIILLFFTSCVNKNQSEISFDINGKHLSYKIDARCTKVARTTENTAHYQFYATSGRNNDRFQLVLINDSLRPDEYRLQPAQGGIVENDQMYGFFDKEDYLNLTITNYKGGVIDGVFYGSLSKTEGEPAEITNGKITNVKVKY